MERIWIWITFLILGLLLLTHLNFSFIVASSKHNVRVKQRNADPYIRNVLDYRLEVEDKTDVRLVVCNLYAEGFSIRAIADMINLNHMKVYRMLKSAGVRLRRFRKR